MKTPNKVWKQSIAYGDTGVRQTLDVMADIVNQTFLYPIVRLTTLDVVADCGRLDELCHLQRIHDFVVENLQYILEGDELLQSPDYLLHNIRSGEKTYGDCDDGTMLIAAMAKSIGYAVRFVAISSTPGLGGAIQHVFAEVKMKSGQWVAIDFTEPEPYRYADKRSITKEI